MLVLLLGYLASISSGDREGENCAWELLFSSPNHLSIVKSLVASAQVGGHYSSDQGSLARARPSILIGSSCWGGESR